MTRATPRRAGAKAALRASLLAWLAVGLAPAIACNPAREPTPRYAFDAEVLDTLDSAMTRLAAGRWLSWTMRIQAGQLDFHIEASAGRGEEAPHRDCAEIAKLVQENVGPRAPWSAEITSEGQLVESCSEAPGSGRRIGSARVSHHTS